LLSASIADRLRLPLPRFAGLPPALGDSFPLGTLAVNLSGCLLIGLIVGLVNRAVLPAAELERVVERLKTMVVDGIVSLSPSRVTSFRSSAGLLPSHLLVRDVMTKKPPVVREGHRLSEAIHLMMREKVKRLPVLDSRACLCGMLSRIDAQGPRIEDRRDPGGRNGPRRAARLFGLGFGKRMGAALTTVSDIMKRDIVNATEDSPIDDAIRLMT
jgi:CBS domain-containing protein